MLPFFLAGINFLSLIIIYYLNVTISNLQKENSALIGNIQSLNNEVHFLQKNVTSFSSSGNTEYLGSDAFNPTYNPNIMLAIIGILTMTVLGLTILVFLKNDSTVIGELSKNSIAATGDYVKEVIVPSVDLLTKNSEARVLANLDNVKKIVTETGAIVTNHVTDVNKEGVLCVLQTLKPQVSTKALGTISRELLNLIP